MALSDDINNLPTTVGDGNTGHLANHQTIHTALKNHQSRLDGVEGRVPETLKLSLDTSVGTRVMAGNRRLMGETGFVKMTGLLSPAPNSGSIEIGRTNNFITLRFNYLFYSPGVSATAQIPEGFRPDGKASGIIYRNAGEDIGRWQFLTSGQLTLWWEKNFSSHDQITLLARSEWPTTLTVDGA